jgi:hypothetical protein
MEFDPLRFDSGFKDILRRMNLAISGSFRFAKADCEIATESAAELVSLTRV